MMWYKIKVMIITELWKSGDIAEREHFLNKQYVSLYWNMVFE